MKLWTDKMPKSCKECRWRYKNANEPYNCHLAKCLGKIFYLDDDKIFVERSKDCPLLDIAEHDKEMRERLAVTEMALHIACLNRIIAMPLKDGTKASELKAAFLEQAEIEYLKAKS